MGLCVVLVAHSMLYIFQSLPIFFLLEPLMCPLHVCAASFCWQYFDILNYIQCLIQMCTASVHIQAYLESI